jgi:hypothetical protein
LNYTEEHSELFDSYLSGNLSGAELAAFEKRLSGDKAFAEAFSVHGIVVEGIRDHGRRDLKAFLAENAKVDMVKGGFGAKKILYAAAAVFALFAGLYAVMNFYTLNKPENIALEKAADMETADSTSMQVPPALAGTLSRPETRELELQSERLAEELNAPQNLSPVQNDVPAELKEDIFMGYGTGDVSTDEILDFKVSADRKIRDTTIIIPVLFAMVETDKMLKTVESTSKTSNRNFSNVPAKKETIILPQNNMSNNAGGINYEDRAYRMDTTTNNITKDADQQKAKVAKKPELDPSMRSFNIEYWVSPINFRGYKFSGNTIQLYGIGPSIARIFHVNSKVYLRIDGIVYTLDPCAEGCPFKTETDPSITEYIINQG